MSLIRRLYAIVELPDCLLVPGSGSNWPAKTLLLNIAAEQNALKRFQWKT